MKHYPIPKVQTLEKIYTKSPSNTILKKLMSASAPYVFTLSGLKKGIQLFNQLSINFETCEWSAKNFDANYKAAWIPKNIPTLILAGEYDHITPLELFTQHKKFQRKNIFIREIKQAGHYPWIENPTQIKSFFKEYCQFLARNNSC